MNIKDLFDKAENGILTYEQFEALSKETDSSLQTFPMENT